jgi:hypothetical protein
MSILLPGKPPKETEITMAELKTKKNTASPHTKIREINKVNFGVGASVASPRALVFITILGTLLLGAACSRPTVNQNSNIADANVNQSSSSDTNQPVFERPSELLPLESRTEVAAYVKKQIELDTKPGKHVQSPFSPCDATTITVEGSSGDWKVYCTWSSGALEARLYNSGQIIGEPIYRTTNEGE